MLHYNNYYVYNNYIPVNLILLTKFNAILYSIDAGIELSPVPIENDINKHSTKVCVKIIMTMYRIHVNYLHINLLNLKLLLLFTIIGC